MTASEARALVETAEKYVRQALMSQVGLKNGVEAKAEGTDVGDYTMGLTAQSFKGAAYPGYTVVLDFVGDGTLTIDPAPVTVTANNVTISADEEVPELTAEVSGVIAPDTDALFTYTLSREEGTDPGSSPSRPAARRFRVTIR